MEPYKLVNITNDDDYEVYQAYSNGSLWNGWLNVAFTKEQLLSWLDATPYDVRFMDGKCIIYMEDEDILESSKIILDDGSELAVYFMDGYCFMLADDQNNTIQE